MDVKLLQLSRISFCISGAEQSVQSCLHVQKLSMFGTGAVFIFQSKNVKFR